MKGATPELLSLLQRKPANIRNICILAHVDHGKTTLADALVASNGIISQRMAGKLRYMDSREDEQLRGITMKSSAISLIYHYKNEEYLINLIDSPGHVDFSSEVSTAVRLCEGAVVVVDVVEGVCPQTHAVLRQAFLENIKPVLVLNKIDRLIVEMKMEPMEAFYHLQQILEQVNLVTNELFTVEAMEKSAVDVDDENGDLSQVHDWTNLEDEGNRNIYFSPDQGNVIFASAYDGWGFSIHDFAVLYASKLGINQEVLQRTLWGDFFLNTKTKRIMKGAQIKAKKPLFVQFVLENLWSVYDSIFIRRDKEKTEKIVTSLGLKIPPRDMRHSDGRVQLQAVCSQWLPVSSAVLRVVVSKLPSPLALSEERVEKLMCSQMRKFDSLPAETQGLKQSFINCSASEESPVIVFVSKMLPVDKKMLPQNKQRPLTEAEIAERRRKAREKMAERAAARSQGQITEAVTQEGETIEGLNPLPEDDPESKEKETDFVFVAFARVFSGTIRKGQKLYVLGPKHDPALISKKIHSGEEIKEVNSIQELSHNDHVTCVTIKDLFVFMGRELEGMDHIPAGNILGIGGLEDQILKSATVSSSLMCPAFCDLYFDAAPIVRVAIEPSHTRDMQKLVEGLRLLNQADPCVQVLVQETGEHVIITAGEVHLQRCVDDLRERYAKIDINVSSPIVPFRETIVPPPKIDMVNEAISDQRQVIKKDTEDDEIIEPGLVEVSTINGRCTLRIRAVPLPEQVTQLLEENQNLIKTMCQISKAHGKGREGLEVQQSVIDSIREFKCQLSKVFQASGKMWRNADNQIWSFGPKRVGPNVLLNRVRGYDRANVWNCVEQKQWELKLRQYDNSIISGFQIATLAGPLCEEPLRGVCFIIEEWNYVRSSHSISLDEEVHKSEVTQINSCDNPTLVNQTESVSTVNHIETDRDKDGSESETESTDSEIEPSQPRQKEGHNHMSGQLIYCVKEGCRKAFQTRPQRLMVAMYKCNIQATAEVLGKLCGVLGKRFGRVIEDTMMEGSQNFNIKAVLPVVKSFGFAEDVRKKTSGLASPQLVFSHWEVLDVDPFWVPTTEEEYAHFGEKADSDNRARHYMNQVRKRKGLKVDEKIVEHAEKQRTLTKMK